MASPLLQFETHPELFLHSERAADLLQRLSEKPLHAEITRASRLEIRSAPETASTGIAPIDALTGGLPRGCLTEICGPESSGRTSVMLSALSAATRREEICALIDASDAFDPPSAAAAGLNLEKLLWVRCDSESSSFSRKRRPAASLAEWERHRREDPIEQALRAADLLLQSSGFGLVVIDLASVSVTLARRIPLTTWFRFRRVVENTPTILLVISTQACAESCASLSLRLSSQSSVVSHPEVLSSQFPVHSCQTICNENDGIEERPSHANLLTGIEIRTEVLRSRNERKPVHSVSAFSTQTAWSA